MGFSIKEMTIEDYDAVYALWRATEGVGLSEADSREGIARFLERNPGLSYIARNEQGELVGAALCGHDGRRGYIHHLAVAESARRQGLGRNLVGRCMYCLMQIGIQKCHLFVFGENEAAQKFWDSLGWMQRVELVMMSHAVPTAVGE
ncbi:MAG: GNAT family N-acetyltransferase [Anaerolineales bacterium]|nr:GNAT family N-acetyltransferase [Anaerolineales bacterium]